MRKAGSVAFDQDSLYDWRISRDVVNQQTLTVGRLPDDELTPRHGLDLRHGDFGFEHLPELWQEKRSQERLLYH